MKGQPKTFTILVVRTMPGSSRGKRPTRWLHRVIIVPYGSSADAVINACLFVIHKYGGDSQPIYASCDGVEFPIFTTQQFVGYDAATWVGDIKAEELVVKIL